MANIYLNEVPPVEKGLKIGLFGGSFSPAHEGHALVAHMGLTRLKLDAIWWIVTPQNPFKKDLLLAPLQERVVEAASLFAHEQFFFTGFEGYLGITRTFDSLAYLTKNYPQAYFVWLMGSDSLENFHQWYRYEEIAQLLPMAIINRPSALNAYEYALFAQKFAKFRIEEAQAERLFFYKAPAWCYIHGLLCEQSSTKIRNLQKQ